MLIVKKIYKSLRASAHWAKALKHASKENYIAAIEEMNQCEKFHRKDSEFLLFKAFLCLAVGEYQDCIRFSSKSIDLLEDDLHLNKDEKSYLTCYAVLITRFAADASPTIGDVPSKFLELAKDYKLTNVNKVIINNFPLTNLK